MEVIFTSTAADNSLFRDLDSNGLRYIEEGAFEDLGNLVFL